MAALQWLIHTRSPHSSIKRLFLFFLPSSVLFCSVLSLSLSLSLTSAFLLPHHRGTADNERPAHPGCSGARCGEEELSVTLLLFSMGTFSPPNSLAPPAAFVFFFPGSGGGQGRIVGQEVGLFGNTLTSLTAVLCRTVDCIVRYCARM